ncbi:snoRNA-binding rRNA-processing protein imp4, partial [Nowakowskiella sp. JEL0078]
MRLVFPNAHRINRGNYVIKEIVDACKSNEVTDLIILHEHRGQPGMLLYIFNLDLIVKIDGMVVCHFPYGPTAYFTLHNVVMRHEIQSTGTVSEQYPHLIFDKF